MSSQQEVKRQVHLLSQGTDAQKEKAAFTLWSLAGDATNKVPIREAGGIPPLVALISFSSKTFRGRC